MEAMGRRLFRRRRLVVWLSLGVFGLGLCACGSSIQSGASTTVREAAQVSASAIDPAAPAFPSPGPVTLHPVPGECDGPRSGFAHEDMNPVPTTVSGLAQRSKAVALVQATYQQAYWVPDGPNTGYSSLGASPETATDFKVLATYKGALSGWVQARQRGARVHTLPQCDGAGVEARENAVPRPGTTYVIFLANDFSNGFWGPSGQDVRLEVRNGRVYSAQYQSPSGPSPVDVNGLDLNAVVRQITG